MHEIDFLAVGDEAGKSGDAIIMRFSRPDTGGLAHVVIDAGWQSTGDKVVNAVKSYYGTSSIDLAILTHPDGDHIGGMGTVVRDLDVEALWLHRIGQHGGGGLPAAPEVEDLISVASKRGTTVYEAFTGAAEFGNALVVGGPTLDYYDELVAEEVAIEQSHSKSAAALALSRSGGLVLSELPEETPFDDAGGTNPRNNSAMIIDLRLANLRVLFTSDAGVPSIDRALDYLDDEERNDIMPGVFQVPHHGSRHNLDSPTLDRIFGTPWQEESRSAQVSISAAAAADPKYPSPRVVNGLKRRGCRVYQTAGKQVCYSSSDAPKRDGWGPVTPLPALNESIDDR